MKKVNEFINSDNLKEIFDRLKEELFYETAHLSSIHQIRESNSYKKILGHGKDILPYIIEEVRKGEYLCTLDLCIIAFELIGLDTPKRHTNGDILKIEKVLIDWWDNKYGK